MYDSKKTVLLVAGTTAALNIPLGFTPYYVEITNLTTRVGHKWLRADEVAASAGGITIAAAGTRALTTVAAGITLNADLKSIDLVAAASLAVMGNGEIMAVEAGTFSYVLAADHVPAFGIDAAESDGGIFKDTRV